MVWLTLYLFNRTHFCFFFQGSRHIFAIIGIVAMHTYVIGFAVGLGKFILVEGMQWCKGAEQYTGKKHDNLV